MKYHPDIDPAERLRFFADRMEAEGRLNVARHMRNGADEIDLLRQRLKDRASGGSQPIQGSATSPTRSVRNRNELA